MLSRQSQIQQALYSAYLTAPVSLLAVAHAAFNKEFGYTMSSRTFAIIGKWQMAKDQD